MKKMIQKCFYTSGQLDFYPQFEKSKTCKTYNDVCFALITENKIIIKDCLNEYAERNNLPLNFLSEKFNRSSYSVCSSPLCNNQKVELTNCIACDSRFDADCKGPFPLMVREKMFHHCPLEVYPSGCYHYEGNYTQRGCIAELTDEKSVLCDQDTELCKKCYGNDCNTRKFFQKCLTNNERAINVPNSKICKRYWDKCFIDIKNGNVSRGCTSEYNETLRDEFDLDFECQNEQCKTCSSSVNCNNDDIPHEYCVVCRDNNECVYLPDYDMRTECPMALKQIGCYLLNDTDSFVERGCLSQLDIEQRNECRSGNGQCKMCMGDSCNIKRTFQICHACDSAVGNEHDMKMCMRNPSEATEIICPNYTDECYSYVKNGTIKRNCIGDDVVSNIQECRKKSDYCQHCSDKRSCNDIKITQQSCISCDSTTDTTCATNSTFDSFEECPLWIHPQSCYHFINKTSGAHKRGKIRETKFLSTIFNYFVCLLIEKHFSLFLIGCIQTLPESMRTLCEKNGAECKTCTGTNCNSAKSFKTCVHCNSKDDSRCIDTFDLNTIKTCNKYNDNCFTQIGKHNVQRGCLNEQSGIFIEECHKDTDKCDICSTNNDIACNVKPITVETCIECSSKTGEACHNSPDSYKGKLCGGINTSKPEGCFLYMVSSNK